MPCPPSESLREVVSDLGAAGVSTVVSLLPDEEAEELGVAEEAAVCAAHGLGHMSYPIVDYGLPDYATFRDLIHEIADVLAANGKVAVHCKAGIGRSGMVAACVLVLTGQPALKARSIVSSARGTQTPDTVEQGKFIAFFEQNNGVEKPSDA